MISTKTQTLGSVISISKGRKHSITDEPSNSSKRLLGIDDLRNDKLLRYTDDKTGTAALPEDLLIAWDGANAGTIGFGKSGFIGSTIARLRIKEGEEIFTPFLGSFLKSKFDYLRQTATGATIPHINRKALESITLPEIDFDAQICIAHLLGKVEGLIAQRKQHLQQLDDLLKSVFLEMFGFRDEKFRQWPIEKLAARTEVVSGVTKGKKYKTEQLIEVPYMRVANVQDGHFILHEIKTIEVTQKEIDQYQLRHGDLLLTEGGDPDKLGRGSVWEDQVENCIHQNHIFRVRINEQANINPYYLSALVGSTYGKTYFLKSAKQTTGIASINSTQLKNFPIVIPPITLQNKFADIVKKVEGIKLHYQQSLSELERLYCALSQKAFNGELNLPRVSLPNQQPETVQESAPLQTPENSPTTQQQERVTIVLPDLANGESLTHMNGRQATIAQWLEFYLHQIGVNAAFSTEHFMAAVSQKLQEQEIEQDGETPSLSIADHDHIKAWVFAALDSGKLTQAFDEERNCLSLHRAPTSTGN